MEFLRYTLYLEKYTGGWDKKEYNDDETDKLYNDFENIDGTIYCWYIIIGYTQYTPEVLSQGIIEDKNNQYTRKRKR